MINNSSGSSQQIITTLSKTYIDFVVMLMNNIIDKTILQKTILFWCSGFAYSKNIKLYFDTISNLALHYSAHSHSAGFVDIKTWF